MPKKKVEPPATVATIQCSICHAVVTPDTYAAHVQAVHAKAPDPAPQATTQTFFQPQSNNNGVQPITAPIMAKDMAGGNYLKGEVVPEGTNEVRFRIVAFVRDPQGRSKLAAQISETYGKTLFGFNTTNIRALMALGFEDLQKVVGKTIVCMLGMAPNPQRNGMPTKTLFVSRVE